MGGRRRGTYFYVDLKNKWHNLGRDLSSAYRALASFIQPEVAGKNMDAIFDRYLIEVLPNLAPRTQSDYSGYIKLLRLVFGSAPPREVTPGHIADYHQKRAERSIVQANREKSCLSAVFTAAARWHCVDSNPCRQIPKITEIDRDRYVRDEEYIAVYNLANVVMHDVSGEVMQGAMDLATITGQREGDLLRLPCNDPHVYIPEGIVFKPNKSKRRHPRHGKIVERTKVLIVGWSEELRAVVDRLRSLGPRLRPTLICTEEGEPYTESGFRSNWHRLMTAAANGSKRKDGAIINEPVLLERFTFHDLRAKRASDAEDLQEANEVLAHGDLKTTQRIYRRKPRRARAGAKILDTPANIRR